MWLLSGPLGVVRVRWGGFGAVAGVDAAAVVEVFDPGGDPSVDLVAGGEGTPVVVLGCEGDPQGLSQGVIPAHSDLPHRHGSCHGAHVGGQFLGGELCSPISMGHDPCGKAPRVAAAMSSVVMTRAHVVLLAHGISRTPRACASRTAHR